MTLPLLIFLVVLLLLIEGFFSGSEIAFVSTNKPKILRMAKEGHREAIVVKKLLENPEQLFSTTVVGSLLCVTTATTLTTIYIVKHVGYHGEWLNLVLLSPMILLFGEFIPKMIGRLKADTMVFWIAQPITVISFVLSPITRVLGIYIYAVKATFGGMGGKSFFLSREEIKAALPKSRGTDVTPSERRLVSKILDFQTVTVKEVLCPLIEVVAIEKNQTLKNAMEVFAETKHSKIPVFEERVDRIVGVIYLIDCLTPEDWEIAVEKVMRVAYFVPESMRVSDVFDDLKIHQLAIAVNEFGGADGILTLEDVIEEIVGDIEDEYDELPKMIYQVGPHAFLVNARIELDELREWVGSGPTKDGDYQTLAGYLLKKMQKIPKKWDSITVDQIEYIIQSATDRSIEEVYVIIHH